MEWQEIRWRILGTIEKKLEEMKGKREEKTRKDWWRRERRRNWGRKNRGMGWRRWDGENGRYIWQVVGNFQDENP